MIIESCENLEQCGEKPAGLDNKSRTTICSTIFFQTDFTGACRPRRYWNKLGRNEVANVFAKFISKRLGQQCNGLNG